MNFYFLKYFYDTVRLNSVSSAAIENFVSQSAVSQGISRLERSLDAKLLCHKRNSLRLTPEGEILYKKSAHLLKEVESLKNSLCPNPEIGRVPFALSHSLGRSLVTPLIQALPSTLKPHLLFGHTGNILQWISQGTIEFGLVLDNDDLTPYATRALYTGQFRFYQSTQTPHFTTCILPPERSEIYLAKRRYYEMFGVHLETEMEICSWDAIAQILLTTDKVGLLPDYLSASYPSLLPSPIDIAIPYTIHIASARNEKLTPQAHRMIAHLQGLVQKMAL
ncbi:MAG: LysR family transcriptional regulator [Simkaniaceae bacterium]|nr:LysR family transcriptional regulator [Simkaniaceae bacterium]